MNVTWYAAPYAAHTGTGACSRVNAGHIVAAFRLSDTRPRALPRMEMAHVWLRPPARAGVIASG